MINFKAILLSALMVALIGCSDDSNNVTSGNADTPAITRVNPSDGATGISPDATIGVKFTAPVDTVSVMNNFYFSGGSPMQIWRDLLDHYGGFGMMDMMHQGHMMDWADSIHMPGRFHWNSSLDSCEFVPDTPMEPNTEYLCLMYEGGMRGHGGGMMGGTDHDHSSYHMYQFTTGP